MLTSQNIFDVTVLHLAKQGVPARTFGLPRNRCMLRGQNNTKCAVGVHITDDEYTSDMEGHSVGTLYDAELLPERLIPFLDLLGDLQAAHDNNTALNDGNEQAAPFHFPLLVRRLIDIGDEYNLDVKVVDEAFSGRVA